MSDPFWADDLSILFRKEKLPDFFPTIQMTETQKLNAITRLSVYSGVLLFLYTGKTWPLYIIVVSMVITLYLYRSKVEEKILPRESIEERNEGIDKHPGNFISYDGEMAEIPEYGYTYSVGDENGEACQLPSKNNPFGNVLLTDYNDNPNRPPACKYTQVKGMVNDHFDHNLYKDVDDIFNKNNSQRMFYTTPITTIPNDQGTFADSLYKVGITCKEDETSGNCFRYNDLRANRPIVVNPERTPVGN